jgi:hypothetical protein
MELSKQFCLIIFRLIISKNYGTYVHIEPLSPRLGWKEANVVRSLSHINALGASNVWSSYRPDDQRFTRVIMGAFGSKQQPEPAFKTRR